MFNSKSGRTPNELIVVNKLQCGRRRNAPPPLCLIQPAIYYGGAVGKRRRQSHFLNGTPIIREDFVETILVALFRFRKYEPAI